MKHTLFFLFLLFSTSLFSQNKNQSIGFRENKGQIIDQKGKPNPDVKFLLNTNGLNVQIKTNGFSYDIYETKKHPLTENQKAKQKAATFSEKEKNNTPDYSLEYIYHRIDIDFVNSNPKVELIAEEKSKDYDNYYNVPNKPDGVLMVHQYQQITYKNIYPNIDVVFSIPKDSLKAVEYNFVVHPKGKISDIQLKFNGAKTDLVENKIKMQVRFGQMDETLPMSWTEDGSCKKEITVGYKKIKNNVYGFESTENVSGKTVVIDPVPTRLWGTFYGNEINYNNLGFTDIETDNFGNIYFTGYTMSQSGSYATSGAHQISIGNPTNIVYDGIIAKFDNAGKRLWGTFYGGEDWDKIYGLKIDNENNLIITGETNSKTNISTTNAIKGYQDTFLVKFNSLGVRIWARYFGGENDESPFDIDIDTNNNIYIVGTTRSYQNISLNNTHQTLLNNIGSISNTSNDGFISKFDKNGTIIWSTYVGGESLDELRCIKVGIDFLVTGGNTFSTTNISTPGTFQEKHNSSIFTWDGMVFKFSLDGNRIWSTYYGYKDKVKAIETDNDNNVYIVGSTAGTDNNNNVASPGSFDDFNQWTETSFLAKLNPSGQRVWGTYIGTGSKIQSVIFKNNFIYIGGMGGNDNSITTTCAYKRDAYGEGYIGKFTKSGDLVLGTYDGGGYDEYLGNKICFENNNIVIGGISNKNNGIADSNSYQSTILGARNFYLIKFSEDTNCNINATPTTNSPVCIGEKLVLNVDGVYNYAWSGPNGFTSTEQNPFIDNTTILNSGLYNLIVSDNCSCQKSYDINVIIGDIEPPIPDLATLPTITGDCKTQITTIPTASDTCAGAITATTTSPLSYNLPGTYTIVWNYADGNGNSTTQNQTVIISSQPLPTTTSPQTFCIQQNATLNSISITGQNIKWYDALTNGNSLANTTLLQNGLTYYASQTINGCESERTPVLINIQNTLAPTADANQAFCTSQNPTIANIQITGNLIKWYDNSINGNLLTTTTNLQNGKTYYVSQIINNCESERLGVTVSIVNTPLAPTANSNQSYCKKENATLKDIQITGQNIKWYDTTFTTAPLPETTLLENNKTYYASQTIGCESDRTPISVQVYDTPLPTGVNNQQFCIDENATISNLNIVGSNIKWYDQSTNGNIIAATTLLQNGKTYFATQTLNNCESERLAIVAKIQDTPIPVANSEQIFCIQKNAKISDIAIAGQNINWFESESSSIILSESTSLQNATTYYASQTISNCESVRIPILIMILEATTEDCIDFVDELPYPKFFTPNNDSYNDSWTIDFAYLKTNTGIKIFDRYGKLLKILNSNSDSWNGTYDGAELPATDYWFVVTRANGKEYKGHFSLKR